MAVPKKKTTRGKRGLRRSHHALSAPSYREDPNTGELSRPHHIDLNTGEYKGRKVIEVKDKL